jgi:hypothetical protein
MRFRGILRPSSVNGLPLSQPLECKRFFEFKSYVAVQDQLDVVAALHYDAVVLAESRSPMKSVELEKAFVSPSIMKGK